MDKQELLTELRRMAASGQISQAEVLAAVSTAPIESESASANMNISNILYYIGGGIVFLGIVVLCYQNWDSFNTVLRIFITLGSCLASLLVAVLLGRYEQLKKVSQAFFLLFGLLAPLAAGVCLKEAGFDLGVNSVEVAAYAVLTAVLFGLYWYFRRITILLFFGIVFATILFHFLVSMLIGNSLSYSNSEKVYEYEFLVIGLVYATLGYYLSQGRQKALSGALYGFGSVFFLGAAMALGGYSPSQNVFWELIYPILAFGIIFLSVRVKSKSFLVFGTLALIGYIIKITGEYFTSGLGWPLALVIAGLLIMLVGYYAVRINRKYLTTVALR